MTQDEMDAETRKYSNDAAILLRLKSGKIAVFNNSRVLQKIVDDDVTINEIIRHNSTKSQRERL